MEQAFRTLLTGAVSVTALVPTAGINWGAAPQGSAPPAIVMNIVTDANGHTLQGVDGLSVGRVQVDCYGLTYASAKAVARAVRALLDGYRGGSFRAIMLEASRDTHDTGAADRPYRISLDFNTFWRP